MKSIICLLFSFCVFNSIKSQSWIQLTDYLGTERDDGISFVINNNAYCLSGLEVGWQCTKNGYVFDGITETWSNMASLPIGKERQYATGFSHNNKGYIFGGVNCSSVCLDDFWEYNPVTDSWVSLPNIPSLGRAGMSNFIIKNKVYIVGGRLTDGTISKEVWEYDFLTHLWVQKSDLPIPGMWRGAAFTIDTTGYICMGLNNSSSYNHYIYRYNYVIDTWTKISTVHLPDLIYTGTAICNKKACLYGGVDSLNTITNSLYIFNPLDSSVSINAGIPTFARKGGMAFSMNDVFYLTTGVTNSFRTKETWKNTGLVGIEENFVSSTLDVFPNPASSILNIEFSPSFEMPENHITIQIIDAFGQNVLFEKLNSQVSVFNINNLTSGIYFYKIIMGNTLIKSNKLIIQK